MFFSLQRPVCVILCVMYVTCVNAGLESLSTALSLAVVSISNTPLHKSLSAAPSLTLARGSTHARERRRTACVHIHAQICTHVYSKCCDYLTIKEEAMGRLRLVGSITLQISFAEYRLFSRALLQKRPIILSILLTEATPYRVSLHTHEYAHMHEFSLLRRAPN